MNESQRDPGEVLHDTPLATFGLMDVVIVLAKRKKQLVLWPIAAAVIAAAIALALPDMYRATTTLLPPQQQQASAAALLSQLGGVAGMAGVPALKNPNDLYVGMLKSRTVADKLIEQFKLKQLYETESQEKARNLLDEQTVIAPSKEGLIKIEVIVRDRQLAARLANAYVSELLNLTRVLSVTEAGQRRLFFEQQLERSKNALTTAEIALKQALDKRGVISVDAESHAIVETAARVKAQISAKEIQINSMRAFVTESNPDYKRANEELISLRTELFKLENGRGKSATDDNTTEAGLQNIKLLRDVSYHKMLFELLAKQYEAARLDEAKDPSIIQVLDSAVEPEKKFRPRRALIVITTFVLAFICSVFWAMLAEVKSRALRVPRNAARYAELRSSFAFGSNEQH
jgi:tyrosine-protein kinase Etk/Wzc